MPRYPHKNEVNELVEDVRMPRELRNLERAASRLRADRQNLEALVREAYDKRLDESQDRAYSLRAIAEAAGMSHEQVRRIVNA